MSASNGGVPPNIIWNPSDPPIKNDCSGMVEIHEPSCDGHCVKSPCTELETELLNENREWARLNMRVSNIPVPLFRISNQINAIIEVIRDFIPDGEEKLSIEFQLSTLNRMKAVRLANQEAVKRVNLGLAPKGVLGPDGKPL